MKIGDRIFRFESCGSTNEVAKELAAQGEPEGSVVIAREQTEGRGRLDRFWCSLAGKGLYTSILLRPQSVDLSLLTLAAGLAVSEALWEGYSVRICLKWPNDLLWEGRKLGGILCESSLVGDQVCYVILGIGLNIDHVEEDFPPALRCSAISLRQIRGADSGFEELLVPLWKRLDTWYGVWLSGRKGEIVSTYLDRSCFFVNQKLVVETDQGSLSGYYKGVDSRGGLLMETPEGTKVYYAAEIVSIQEKKEV